MIPTLLLGGLLIGLLPRWWPIVGIIIAATIWTILFALDDLLASPVDTVFVFVLGAVNLTASAFVTWLVKQFARAVLQDRRG
ncbi:MAG TPA: hypothetical protein VNZ55_04125 [Thermomicrobiales bacterium]|nr:hypothetical protein [Thermomicrobiales bacterium]